MVFCIGSDDHELDSVKIADIIVQDINGKDVRIGDLFKKVTLIVNVASYCGLAKRNYTELEPLYKRYKDSGLQIIAFPCNQFRKQEPRCSLEVHEEMTQTYQISFPMMDKIQVNGPEAHILYKYLKHRLPGFITDSIKWNFTKFMLVDGVPVRRYAPIYAPGRIESDIVRVLLPPTHVTSSMASDDKDK